MGRWAQRRLRGGGPNTSAPLVISVRAHDGDFAEVTFDRPAAADNAPPPGAFVIAGTTGVVDVFNLDPVTIDVQMDAPVGVGEIWQLVTSTGWLSTFVAPASGLTV